MGLQELIHRVKQLEIALTILCAIICIIIIYTFWPHKGTISVDEQVLAAQMATIVEHDRQRDSVVQVLEYRIRQDSLRIAGIRNQVDDVPAIVKRINNRYNDKRNHITTLSADEQLELFSTWLSTQDSL